MPKPGCHDTRHTTLGSIFGEDESILKLTSGGEPKEALVRDIVSSLEEVNDQPAEEDMIAAIMETLGKEGTTDDDVRREAALALVTDPTFAEILVKHDSTLYNRYVASIEHIQASQETVHGPVDALLEAGKAFTPVFARNVDKQRIIGIVKAWSACANRMEEPSVQRHIRKELTTMEQRLSDALEERRAQIVRKTEKKKEQIVKKQVNRTHNELSRHEAEEYIIQSRESGKKRDVILAELAKKGITRDQYNKIVTGLLARGDGSTRDARWRKPKQ